MTVAYAVLSLVAIRMACVVLAMAGSGARRQTVAFMGWFGPRGLATLVFAVLVIDENIANGNVIASAAIAGVVLSVFAHGLTAPPLVSTYTRWWNSHPRADGAMEARSVHEHAARIAHSHESGIQA